MAADKFVFTQRSFQLSQRFQEKPAIVSVHRISCDHRDSLAPHAYFAEQLSLLRCAVRYRTCGQDREWQESSRRIRRTPMSAARKCESPALRQAA
jgi:hypothetical protein